MAKIALLVGISIYKHTNDFTSLFSTRRDVEAMEKVLKSPSLCGFDQVKTLFDPTRQEMAISIENLFQGKNNDDMLLFYYGGYGVDDLRGNLYLTSKDTQKDNQGNLIKSTALPARDIQNFMTDSRSKHQIIILDCCKSGAFAEGLFAKGDSSFSFQGQMGGEGKVVLTSCTSTQYSYEREGSELSIYTQCLVQGLETGDADLNNDGCISANDLHKYVKQKVVEIEPSMKPQIYAIREGYEILIKNTQQNPNSDPARYPRIVVASSSIFTALSKYRKKYKVNIFRGGVIIFIASGISLVLNPYFQDGVVRSIIGGESLEWKKSMSTTNELNTLFKWYPGSKKGSSYEVLAGNKLRIKAAPGTEYWRRISEKNNLPPDMSFTPSQDFEATVKVTLKSQIDYQRAYFGVRDSKNKHRQMLMYLMEKSRIESATVDEDVDTLNKDNAAITTAINLSSNADKVYFKIRKRQDNFDLLYSENGIFWNSISGSSNSVFASYDQCEIFFTVTSTPEDQPAVGDFSNLSIKYIQ